MRADHVAGRTVGAVLAALLAWAGGAAPIVASASPAIPGTAERAAAAAADDGADVSWLVQPAGEFGGSDVRTYLMHDVDPGQSVSDAIAITNLSETDLTLRIAATDAFSDPQSGGFSLLPTDDAPADVGAWVQLPASEVTVPARSRAEVPVLISVPSDATPGDHVGGIITSHTGAATDENGQPVLVEARIAMRVYLSVTGERQPALSVSDVHTTFTLGADQATGTMRTTFTVRNTGNTRLGADEAVSVQGPFGLRLDGTVRSSIAEILPGDDLQREVVVEDVPAALALTTRVAVTPIDVTDDDRELAPVVVKTTVAAVPWLALVGLVLVVAVIWWFVRRRRHRWRALHAELAAARATQSGPAAPGADDAGPESEPAVAVEPGRAEPQDSP